MNEGNRVMDCNVSTMEDSALHVWLTKVTFIVRNMSFALQLRGKGAGVKEQEEYTTPEKTLNNDSSLGIILLSAQFVVRPNEDD